MLDTIVANVKLHVEGELEKGERFLLKGCTPDSCDILRYNVYLDSPKVGQKIVFLNCGAYTYTTDFCTLPKIKIEGTQKQNRTTDCGKFPYSFYRPSKKTFFTFGNCLGDSRTHAR